MARKKRGGGDVGEGANWMDTYGDLVTLLLCFFVLLFASSTVDAQKWEAIVGAFTGMGTGVSAIPAMDIHTVIENPVTLEVDTSLGNTPHDPNELDDGNGTEDLDNFKALVAGINEFLEQTGLDADIFEDEDTLTVTMRVNDNIFFDSGDATLKPESLPILESLSALCVDYMTFIDELNVEGHTDTDPIKTAKYKDNLDLSTDRAANTVRYMINCNEGIDPARIVAKGMSEYRPIATNDTPEGKAMNRRVDFVFQSAVTGNTDTGRN